MSWDFSSQSFHWLCDLCESPHLIEPQFPYLYIMGIKRSALPTSAQGCHGGLGTCEMKGCSLQG